VAIVLGALAGAARYRARKVRHASREWRRLQESTRQASAETAELARAMHLQVSLLVAREYEDRRRINELLWWRRSHDATHAQRGGY